MTIVITAFERAPDGGKGLARDTRVRWALEEVGQPYEVRLVSFRAKKEPAHLRLHPFGLIPTYEEGDLALFETGAIVFHIADHHPGLFPDDGDARARAITWIFAALNTVEPPILELVNARFAEGDKPWAEERVPLVKDRIRDRLAQLSARLGDADWLDGAFSAGDLMMASVLLRLRASGLLDESRSWLPMLRAAKRGPHTNGLSPPNGRSTAVIRRLGDEVLYSLSIFPASVVPAPEQARDSPAPLPLILPSHARGPFFGPDRPSCRRRRQSRRTCPPPGVAPGRGVA